MVNECSQIPIDIAVALQRYVVTNSLTWQSHCCHLVSFAMQIKYWADVVGN